MSIQPSPPDIRSAPIVSMPETAVSRVVNGLVNWIARHWLLLFNTAWGTYVILPVLAPIFMHFGLEMPARLIYAVYSVLCHQLPDHSYFLFGDSLTPLQPELIAGGMEAGLNPLQMRRFIGNEHVGHKFALCERDMAIYGSVLLGGLAFAVIRRWKRIRPLSVPIYILFLVPMAIDGLTQLFGLRQSDWLLRSLTGGLFGLASVWLAYPYVEEAMQDAFAENTIENEE